MKANSYTHSKTVRTSVLLMLVVIFAGSAFSQSKAVFSVNNSLQQLACKTVTVKFDNKSTCLADHPCMYVWNWGDGSKNDTVIKKTVSHTYNKDNWFTVTLTVIDSVTKEQSGSPLSKKDYIKVYVPNAQDFTNKEDTVTFQHLFDVSAAFKPKDKSAWLYEWSWGDGSADYIDTISKTRHLFPKENFSNGYDVTLKVKINPDMFEESDAKLLGECMDSATRTIEVTDGFYTDATKKNQVSSRVPNLPNIITPDDTYGSFSLDSTDANPELKSNDIWYFKPNGESVFTLRIYNRWGSLVYEKTGKVVYWDGLNMSENPVESGAYYYVIESDEGDKRHNKAGYIHVFRQE